MNRTRHTTVTQKSSMAAVTRSLGYSGAKRYAVSLTVVMALAALWYYVLKEDSAHGITVSTLAHLIKAYHCDGPLVILLYVVCGFIVFPVAVLITATAFVLGPLKGGAYSLMGLSASATVLYFMGTRFGTSVLSMQDSSPLKRLSQKLTRHSLLTIITLRLLPVAPYTVVNVVAGSFGIRFGRYTVGTIIGMLPSVAIMSLAGSGAGSLLKGHMDTRTFCITFTALSMASAIFFYFKYRKSMFNR